MKIGLLNFHFAYNYGAVLQSTALMRQLQKMGHNVEIINYRPFYQMQYYLPYPNPFLAAAQAWRKMKKDSLVDRSSFTIKWFLRTILNYKQAKDRKTLKCLFEPYVEKTFEQTHVYSTYNELLNSPPTGLDVLVCGSDQLWNPDVTWGIDPAYYLNFGDSSKRIAYAVSPCGLNCERDAKEINKAAERLDAISLREFEKRDVLCRVLNRNDIKVCPDPTLLLSESDYKSFEEEISEEDNSYILFYGFNDKTNNQRLMQIAVNVSNHYKLPIIDMSIDRFNWSYDGVIEKRVTPGQFLVYIKKARFIVTNSFHGTVFSIIYRKDFNTVYKTGTASRMKELLDCVGLSNRIINSSTPNLCHIEYDEISNNIMREKEKGLNYLESVL